MLRKLVCPACGAPLPPVSALAREATCSYCGASFALGADVVNARDFKAAREEGEREAELTGAPTVRVADVTYRVLGRIARGESTDVFLAERAFPLPERVVLKVLRAPTDAELLEREHRALVTLHASEAKGTAELSSRIAQPVGYGPVVSGGAKGPPALVQRYVSGFFQTMEDVRRAYPAGVDPRAVAWMWRRVLEALAWIHSTGWAHGSILPPHLLVHARDHGVMLVGWSCATRPPAPLPAICARYTALYPDGAGENDSGSRSAAGFTAGGSASFALDLVMAARCMVLVSGGAATGWETPPAVPAPLARLLRDSAAGVVPGQDAWGQREQVGKAAYESFGPPQYHRFEMPGWP